MIPTSQPNKAEKDWREWVRAQGCILGHFGPVEIHHPVGRTAKHLRVPIGHWFVLPVATSAHRVVESWPMRYQVEAFRSICADYLRLHYEMPFPAEVAVAIWNYHR